MVTEHRDLTSNRFEFYTYRVGRSQLDRLFSVAAEGFTPEQVTIGTERSGTRLTRSTLEDLVSAVAASSLPGDPNVWENLSFAAFADGRNVSIDINELWLRAVVSGHDATWVHGQAARLKAIIDPVAGEMRPYEIRARRSGRIAFLSGILAALATVVAYRASKDAPGVVETVTGATTVGAFFAIIVFFIGTAGKGKTRTLLSATEEIYDRRWWEDLSIADKVALSGLGFTALAAIAALLSAYADVWGS